MKIQGQGDGWGNAAQIEAHVAQVLDLHRFGGNQDGVWNENADGRDIRQRNHVLSMIAAFAGSRPNTTEERRQFLADFLAAKEKELGRPVTDPNLRLDSIPNGYLMAVEKAAALERLGRTPDQVTEGVLTAVGKVGGDPIEPRKVFWQRFKPTGEPNGKMVVVSPGFQETGRNFYDQIQELNRRGYDVIAMDHQWAGYTQGKPGGLDRLFSAARDVATVAAYAQSIVDSDPAFKGHADREVILYGNSMGAAAVLAAATMRDNGMLSLSSPDLKDGGPGGQYRQMPKGLKVMAQVPFLGATPNALNKVAAALGHIPVINKMELWASEQPRLTDNKDAIEAGRQDMMLADTRVQAATADAPLEDLKTMKALFGEGKGPSGQVFVIYGDKDRVADAAETERFIDQMKGRVVARRVETEDHVYEQDPTKKMLAIEGIEALAGR